MIFFPVLTLHAQQSRMFPLALVLEAAEFTASGAGTWQPNWPLDLPPDAFRLSAGEVSAITLEGENIHLRVSYDTESRLREFPFMLNGGMAQVSVTRLDGKVREMALSFLPGEELWTLEFLDHHDSYFSLVRVSAGNAWYFVTLSRWARGITETWFDVEGNVLGAYAFSLAEMDAGMRIRSIRDLLNSAGASVEHYHDSWGFLTQVSEPGGLYTVLHFREAFPRYWERRPSGGNAEAAGIFYLQWDANGFLTRKTRTAEEPGFAAGPFTEYRFEYTLDEKGNWIERREIRMIQRGSLLFPSPGSVFTRVLEYR